jgi:hypothetical protein
MLTHHSATVLPFRASARRLPTPGRATLEHRDGIGDATPDNVVLLRDNVTVLAGWHARRIGPSLLFPPPGGEAA